MHERASHMWIWVGFLLWCVGFSTQLQAIETEVLCPGIEVRGKIEPGLSDTEKKLVCGDDKLQSAWKHLPFSQIRYNFSNFLQQRGYHHPQFELGADGHAVVDTGSVTRVFSLEAAGVDPSKLRLRRKRKVVGEILTPSLLGSTEQWVTQRLQAEGFPCPVVRSEANPGSGRVQILVTPGPEQNLDVINEESIPGMRGGILRRYDAFRLGEKFNGDLLTITENRVAQASLLQDAHFTTQCGEKSAVAYQHSVAGPPRLLTFGFGASTETLLLAKSTWRNTRIGNSASNADVTLFASFKEQELTAQMRAYVLPFPTRRYFQPLVTFKHQNEDAFEVLSGRAKLGAATTWDNSWLGVETSVGPVFEIFRTLQGSGAGDPNSRFTSLEGVLRMRSHDFEYWATNPRAGFNSSLTVDFAGRNWLSSASAQRLKWTGQVLYNLLDYDPPLLVLGARGGVSTTWSPERPGPATALPAAFFYYLGGSMDLRGFARRSIPGYGAMTTAFLDFEARLTEGLPLGIESLFFVDVGGAGATPFALESPLLWSPGAGLRYKSPFGVFRTTIAHGYPEDMSGGWHFFLSFGEEF